MPKVLCTANTIAIKLKGTYYLYLKSMFIGLYLDIMVVVNKVFF